MAPLNFYFAPRGSEFPHSLARFLNMRPLSCFAPPQTPFKIKAVVEGLCLYHDNSHSRHRRISIKWAPSRHLTVSLRDFEPVSDTPLPSGILCQVGNTRVFLPQWTINIATLVLAVDCRQVRPRRETSTSQCRRASYTFLPPFLKGGLKGGCGL